MVVSLAGEVRVAQEEAAETARGLLAPGPVHHIRQFELYPNSNGSGMMQISLYVLRKTLLLFL